MQRFITRINYHTVIGFQSSLIAPIIGIPKSSEVNNTLLQVSKWNLQDLYL
jgi:hypothetical protein